MTSLQLSLFLVVFFLSSMLFLNLYKTYTKKRLERKIMRILQQQD